MTRVINFKGKVGVFLMKASFFLFCFVLFCFSLSSQTGALRRDSKSQVISHVPKLHSGIIILILCSVLHWAGVPVTPAQFCH